MIFASITRRIALTSLLLQPSLRLSSAALPPRLRVTLIRHGESENNILSEIGPAAYRSGRFADPPLTELGKSQALATSKYLSSPSCNALIKSPSTIYVSPFLRTLQTSSPTSLALPEPEVVVWDRIFEVGGCYKDGKPQGGLNKEEVEKMFGYTSWYPCREPGSDGWYKLAGKESKEEALERIKGVAAELKSMARECEEKGEDRCIYMFVHGDFIDYLMEVLLGIPTAGNQSRTVFRTYNCGITSFDLWKDGMIKVLWVNFVGHLDGFIKEEKLGTV
mmetsp:Transcript_7889/g.15788  ORF Transcript_7889/g.15788 Transcript_7889/m.15788 type:complete len:277 (-) Transcript_7889:54-884(-)|eukprot:CAMPEP_0118642360 /NCGR_PEP_ID=MMETSP0785-20121206/5793_1 /TAXON_ID=91992 /ORGANISM="Bolidomonas pacifica, Strain CCMP 1866" /LENGTH=276 /DNA_ID=CAMNT_0006533905 /DNA_START=89 /DNA_END=919 /DNA_ORIENTATION=-